MIILPILSSDTSASEISPASDLCEGEQVRLQYVQLTVAAERHLVSIGTSCPDHHSCRRLAFARFLYLTHRLGDDARR
jgi:hypothetical protein